MGRNVTIHIDNQTGYDMVYKSADIEHGKYNQDPPPVIKNGTTGTFKVGNHTGAKIGPKGTLTYKVALNHESGPVEIDLTYYWDHPFSAATSSYSVSSNPVDHVSYNMSPPNPEGHDQEITLTTYLKNLDKVYQLECWMKSLDGNPSLSELTIPGTHDSGADRGGDLAKCQTMTIAEQLKNGIRFFDIRLNGNQSVLRVFHGPIDMHLTFEEVQSACVDFLTKNPSESIIMLVNKSQGGGDPIASKFKLEIEQFKSHWWLENSIPNLSEAKGKIVLIRRFENSGTLGIDASSGWEDDSPSFDVNNGNIHVQDKYKVWYTAASINGKWDDIQATMDYAQTSNKMVINFTSGGTHMTPVTLATGKALDLTGVECINVRLYNTVTQGKPRKLGILAMDFPESPDPLLMDYIVSLNNFK